MNAIQPHALNIFPNSDIFGWILRLGQIVQIKRSQPKRFPASSGQNTVKSHLQCLPVLRPYGQDLTIPAFLTEAHPMPARPDLPEYLSGFRFQEPTIQAVAPFQRQGALEGFRIRSLCLAADVYEG
jgi:hypothetical protein